MRNETFDRAPFAQRDAGTQGSEIAAAVLAKEAELCAERQWRHRRHDDDWVLLQRSRCLMP